MRDDGEASRAMIDQLKQTGEGEGDHSKEEQGGR